MLASLEDGVSDNEGRGGSDVFTGKNDHAAGDIEWILAGFEHASKIIEGGVGLAGTHGFDEGANDVIEFFSLFIESELAALESLFDIGEHQGIVFGEGGSDFENV